MKRSSLRSAAIVGPLVFTAFLLALPAPAHAMVLPPDPSAGHKGNPTCTAHAPVHQYRQIAPEPGLQHPTIKKCRAA
jgi:hypothetical protein